MEGKIYSRLERALMNRTELFLFEGAFARNTYLRHRRRTEGPGALRVQRRHRRRIRSAHHRPDATDVVYVGEFEHIKGADLLIDAVAKIRAKGKPVKLTLGGDGEETAALKAQTERLKLGDSVEFAGHVKARCSFFQGRLLVVPSRGVRCLMW